MFWQNTWNMKQPITGLKSQLVGDSQLAIQAWPRRWTQDDWEQIQEVARVGFESRNTQDCKPDALATWQRTLPPILNNHNWRLTMSSTASVFVSAEGALYRRLATMVLRDSSHINLRSLFVASQPTPSPLRTLRTTSFRNCWLSLWKYFHC